MGEIAEAMLDGTFCYSCGEALIGPKELGFESEEPNGFPTLCPSCQED